MAGRTTRLLSDADLQMWHVHTLSDLFSSLRRQAYSSSSCPSGTCPGMGDLYNQIMTIGYKINPSARTSENPSKPCAPMCVSNGALVTDL